MCVREGVGGINEKKKRSPHKATLVTVLIREFNKPQMRSQNARGGEYCFVICRICSCCMLFSLDALLLCFLPERVLPLNTVLITKSPSNRTRQTSSCLSQKHRLAILCNIYVAIYGYPRGIFIRNVMSIWNINIQVGHGHPVWASQVDIRIPGGSDVPDGHSCSKFKSQMNMVCQMKVTAAR